MCKAEKILMERARQRGMKDGLEKGLKDGLEKGIMGAIEMLLEVGKSVADIHAALMRQYSLDADEASRYLALKGLSL